MINHANAEPGEDRASGEYTPRPPAPRRILRLPEVMHHTGLKRSQIYNLMQSGTFPKSIKLSARSIGFDSREIDRWIDEKLQQRGR